jgi:DNA-binding CsgD family transcriptional regulator
VGTVISLRPSAVARERESRWLSDQPRQTERRQPGPPSSFEGERLTSLVGALEAAAEQRSIGLIQLDRSGRIVHLTAAAAELLAAYCGEEAARSFPPVVIDAWRTSGGGSLAIDGTRGRLALRLIDDGAWPAILLEEQRSTPPAVCALKELGLTTRQGQVLRLLACGKSNQQIARELAISNATVRKHLEHIYMRLGVNSRAQAIVRVLG